MPMVLVIIWLRSVFRMQMLDAKSFICQSRKQNICAILESRVCIKTNNNPVESDGSITLIYEKEAESKSGNIEIGIDLGRNKAITLGWESKR